MINVSFSHEELVVLSDVLRRTQDARAAAELGLQPFASALEKIDDAKMASRPGQGTGADDDAREREELARLAADTGNPRLVRLVEEQNQLGAALEQFLETEAKRVAEVKAIRERIERLEAGRN